MALAVGFSLCTLVHAGVKHKQQAPSQPTCHATAWSERAPVQPPALPAGAVWTYIAGEDIPPNQLKLTRTTNGQNIYVIDNRGEYVEVADTYTEHHPGRKGQMTLIRFPVQVGDTWEDEFEEEGEFRSQHEHYLYDYKEKARSRVLGIETIDVAAGRFRALHIVREASWVKSNPREASPGAIEREGNAKETEVPGWTITHLWYAPTIGRAVMKASMRIGDPLYIPADNDSILTRARAAIVELQSYEGANRRCANKPLLQAKQPETFIPIGYPLVFNNTWQWSLQAREHRPRRAE